MSRSKDKGTFAESAVADYLKQHGWPYAERRALAGAVDKGDITGTPGLAWEVKYAGVGLKMSEWIQETVTERRNAGAAHGILVVKPFGYGAKRTGDWFAAMVGSDYDNLTRYPLPGLTLFGMATQPYSANRLRADVTAMRAIMDPHAAPFLTLRPRGKSETPGDWYRVTTLWHMTRVLRAAGFGDQLPS